MKMKCAGELMLPLEAFPYIPYWFTLRQALATLADPEAPRHYGKGTPWMILVFNAQNQFLGIVQRQNILQGLRPTMRDNARGIYDSFSGETLDPNLSRLGFTPERAIQELRRQIERQIIEFITPVQMTINYEDAALLAVHMMIDRDLTFVPVVKDGQVVGIVYMEEALKEVMGHII